MVSYGYRLFENINIISVHISRTYLQVSVCEVPVPAGWLSFHCSGTLECNFLTIVSTMPPFEHVIHFIRKFFLVRPHPARGLCVLSSLRPSCATPRVCVPFFIPPICRSGTRYFQFFGATKFEVQRTFPLARPL